MTSALPSWKTTPGVAARYAIFEEIASGGMATVHLGRLVGAGGFARIVAVKRLHPHLVKDKEFSTLFMDEARLASRIHHPHVVQTLDVVAIEDELLLVMEYVHGVSFAQLLETSRKKGLRVSPRVISAILVGVLEGLHAAHDARSEAGEPLGVVHRDVSPQNILVGAEGQARILDFGVAKAMGQVHSTRQGQLKGKLAYMSPEQVRGQPVSRMSDVFSASVVLWEALVGEPLFDATNAAELILRVLDAPIGRPSERVPDLPAELDAVVMKGLARELADRFTSARQMAAALEGAVGVASPREIAAWVEAIGGEALA